VKTEVLVNGHFAVLHAGHIKLLEFASRYGLVTVALNSDYWSKLKYGNDYIPLTDRAYVLRSNRFVHNVVVFDEETPGELILQLRPETIVKGPDYIGLELAEQWAINRVSAKVIYYSGAKTEETSSSGLLKKSKLPLF